MTIKRFNDLAPGGNFSASEENRLREKVESLSNLTGSGGSLVKQTIGGLHVVNGRPVPFYARISGAPTTRAHPWTQQRQSSSGTFSDDTEGRTGTATAWPAYALDGSATVATNSIGLMHLANGGEYYWFELVRPAKALWVRFALYGTLTVTNASVLCTVDSFWGGPDPGSTTIIYNPNAKINYIFEGSQGHRGLATWDNVNAKYWMVQLECP